MSQRCASENASWKAGIGELPSLIFQKMAPSVCCDILGSDKLPGLRSNDAAAGPSPLPEGPWHGRQPTVKSSFPRARDLSSAAVGFSLRAARAGAVQTLVPFLDASCPLMTTRSKQTAASSSAITDGARLDFGVEHLFMGSSFFN